jgi:HK97 gp10 family phage protein
VYEGKVGATAHYAIYIEFGTRKMSAQPFLRPAAVILKSGATMNDIKDAIADAMKQYTRTFS